MRTAFRWGVRCPRGRAGLGRTADLPRGCDEGPSVRQAIRARISSGSRSSRAGSMPTAMTHEAVYDIAGDPDNGADVDYDTCEPIGAGIHRSVHRVAGCDVRSLRSMFSTTCACIENPTCRWSTRQCHGGGRQSILGQLRGRVGRSVVRRRASAAARARYFESCCLDSASEPFYTPIIQERAWTSPIWYSPASIGAGRPPSREHGDDPA